MDYTIKRENIDNLASYWVSTKNSLHWNSLFTLPVWLKVWWREFGAGNEQYISVISQGDDVIGIAPLLIAEEKASFISSTDVCDYLDFVIAPARDKEFFNILFDELTNNGIKQLDLRTVRPDSTVLTSLVDICKERSYQVFCEEENVSSELYLPSTWEEYLGLLTKKQRHEVRRKLRRLAEAGDIKFHFVTKSDTVSALMDTFFNMFTESRQDKATFLNASRESFFRMMTGAMADAGLLKLGVLEMNDRPLAMIICFDYNDCIFLYNSAYEPSYNSLSVGLVSKILCIRESIQLGKKKFDFLNGDEPYKARLGGVKVPLSSCRITIS
ncbi:GNAT family N-acetyltransferase [Chloroflexota bacterium]